jgi:hypothetical protein
MRDFREKFFIALLYLSVVAASQRASPPRLLPLTARRPSLSSIGFRLIQTLYT